MNINDIWPILSTLFFFGGFFFALFKWLWGKFEERMDTGDAKIMKKLEEVDVRNEVRTLELQHAEMKGRTDTLIAIFGRNNDKP